MILCSVPVPWALMTAVRASRKGREGLNLKHCRGMQVMAGGGQPPERGATMTATRGTNMGHESCTPPPPTITHVPRQCLGLYENDYSM